MVGKYKLNTGTFKCKLRPEARAWAGFGETRTDKHKYPLYVWLSWQMLTYSEVMCNRASRALLQRYAKFSRPLYNDVLTCHLARIFLPSFHLICKAEQSKICGRRLLVLKCQSLILILLYKNAKLNRIQNKFQPAWILINTHLSLTREN